MSYTTRCPACGTMFKVVPDQLKISDGWVRCGHCADVFDATLYLDEWADGQAPLPAVGDEPKAGAVLSSGTDGNRPAEMQSALAEVLPTPLASEPGSTVSPSPVQGPKARSSMPWPFDDEQPGEQLTEFSLLHDAQAADSSRLPDRVSDALARALTVQVRDGAPHLPSRSVLAQSVPAPASAALDGLPAAVRPERGISEDFHAELKQFASGAGATDAATVDIPIGLPLHADEEAQYVHQKSEALGPRISPSGLDLDEPEPVPEFVQQARRKAFWRRPTVRVMLLLMTMLLTGTLLAQWGHHERHRLVAWQPRLEPLLGLICSPPSCEIGPLRRIDDIVIDSAALVRRQGDAYAFDFVLKNLSEVPLAVPALELSLTDTRDQTMVRRVFLPSEWPGQPVTIPARGSVSVSLRLAIALGDGVAMAGYRALVFYP